MIPLNKQLLIVMFGLFLASLAFSTTSTGMTFNELGDQLILSGPVTYGDADHVRRTLANNPSITTVILRNSPGGDVSSGYAVGALLRQRGVRTAVSGYCYSSCSRMFLGGKVRVFTDDYPMAWTNVGFHGHYGMGEGQKGMLNVQMVQRQGLKDWIIKYSDGKADPDLVERWIYIPINIGMIHFFHPQVAQKQNTATFLCERGPKLVTGVFGCEAIGKTAIDLGVATSPETIKSNDQAELRASLAQIPTPTGYARIDELDKVPLTSEKALEEYKRYLQGGPPKAFAVAPDKSAAAWRSGNIEAITDALSRCAERAKKPCVLYALDHDVVWQPGTPNQ